MKGEGLTGDVDYDASILTCTILSTSSEVCVTNIGNNIKVSHLRCIKSQMCQVLSEEVIGRYSRTVVATVVAY
jgi:hypothetical protein